MTDPNHETPKKAIVLDEDDQEQRYQGLVPTPPDGGWGWMVVFASFMIHVLADGFTYTFGIFYVHLLDYYGVSKSAASWIASILVGVTLGSGPISGSLVNKFGCRMVTIAGALLASCCLLMSMWAPTIAYLYVTIGLGVGLGFGLIYLPAIVCVTGYFEKRRSFATGIAVCGSGIGTFAFSPFIEYLIETLGWKGAMMVISGVMLNCVVFGSLFRPLEDNCNPPEVNPFAIDSDGPNREGVRLDDLPAIEWSKLKDLLRRQALLSSLKFSADDGTVKKNHSDANLVGHGIDKNDLQRICSHGNLNPPLDDLSNQGKSHSQPLLRNSQTSVDHFGSQTGMGHMRNRNSLPGSHSGSGLLYRRDIFYRGSLLNFPEYKQSPSSYRASIIYLPDEEETERGRERAKICGFIPCSRETSDALHNLMDCSLLSDGIFILFVLSNFCTSTGFNAPYLFIVDRAREMDINSDQASLLLSVIGISNTISRVVLGYFSDKTWVNRLYTYNVALTLCGVATCVSVWLPDFGSQCFYAAVFGATSGAYVGLTSVVLVDLLGMERLTNAFGLLLLFQGIASLIGPPLCGALYSMSKSYDYSFLLAGFMIAISGLMLFAIPCIWKLHAKRAAKQVPGSTSNRV